MIQLTVSSLTKTYGSVTALSGISFQAASAITGISGHNGSGKSTLLKCIAGLLKPSKGTVAWKINGTPAKKEHITRSLGFSAPYINLYEELTVAENLKFISEIRSGSDTQPLGHALSRFECAGFAQSLYGSLSTGQQQRVRLAAATLHNPSILLLDEPGSNLDQKGRELVKNIAADYKNREHAMLIIASNQKEELALCSQIIDLNSN